MSRPANGNPLLHRIAERGQTGSGRTSEKRVAQSIAARLTANSGAGNQKGDMTKATTQHRFRMEAKSTKAATMSLELGWLVKIANEALNTKSVPALTISFTDEAGKARAGGDWVMVPLYVFKELIEGE